jgi:hypothetical protein
MTPETRKTWLWTGVTLAGVIIILVILWAAGVGEKGPEPM